MRTVLIVEDTDEALPLETLKRYPGLASGRLVAA